MALSFPNSPTVGQIYTDSVSGFSYEWDGTVWKSFAAASSANLKIIDDISSSFNGVTQTFSLTSNSFAVTPPNAQSLIVNLGGVIQDPTDDYSVSGSQITFSTPPAAGLSFSAVSIGVAIPITQIPANTTTDGAFNVSGILSATSLRVAGVTTADSNGVTVASGQSIVVGSAVTISSSGVNVTGVGTFSSRVNVGTAVTIDSSGLNATGVGTFSSRVNVGTAITANTTGINVTGVVTATSFVGSGANLTNLNIPTSFNEIDAALFS